jgi:NADH:ubiquinone oxidoreductase subunit E
MILFTKLPCGNSEEGVLKKNKVIVCTGTTCFVMGGSELLLLEDQLPPELKETTEVEGATCLDFCKKAEYGKAQSDYAPFVQINDTVLEQATAAKIIEKLKTLP